MELSINSVEIREVQFGMETKIEDGVLSIRQVELKNLIMDHDFFKDVEIEIVHPGENVRILRINDVIEPRAKVEPDFSDFPGVLGKIGTVGKGTTLALKGVSVILIDHMAKGELGFLDMSGLGSELSPYGKLHDIIIHPIPLNSLEWEDYQYVSKVAALKAAVYLAQAARHCQPDRTEFFGLNLPLDRDLNVDHKLPRVAYYFQIHAKQFSSGNREPIFYGHNLRGILPMAVHPNEVLDGAIIRGYVGPSMETYSIQNHAMIQNLYHKHGKELLFVGVVVGVSALDEGERERSAVVAANLISNILRADGVILTKAYGGAAHADLERTAEVCEEMGLKTVLMIQILTQEASLEEGVLITSDKLDALVNTGYFNEKVILPPVERVIGGLPSDLVEEQPSLGEITARLRLLIGATSQLGKSLAMAVQY